MYKSNTDEKSQLTLQSGINNILLCTFSNLGSESINGGAINCAAPDSQIIVSECSFHVCKGRSGGALYISNEVLNAEFLKCCVNGCSNTYEYGFFAVVRVSTGLSASMITMIYNQGISATAAFVCIKQTLRNINTTNNKGTQEAGYLSSKATYSTSKFIHVSSNQIKKIGINFHNGNNYFVSHMNYKNCSFTTTTEDNCFHVFIDHITTQAVFTKCYISASSLSIGQYNSVNVSISNSYFPNVFTPGSITVGSNVFTANTKTLTFSFHNTKLCKLQEHIFCTRMIDKRKTITCKALLYISLLTV